MKITVKDRIFDNKKQLTEHIRTNIISKTEDFKELDQYNHEFMLELLSNHPNSDQKIGDGITKIWVQKNLNYPNRGFWLERIDGTKTDFSYLQCITPKPQKMKAKEAFRKAIQEIVIKFRHNCFSKCDTLKCPVLNKSINIYNSHVDHEPPQTFEKILDDFITKNNLNLETIELEAIKDGNIGNKLVDKNIELQWIEYHNNHAKLRVVSAEANLSDVKRGANHG